MVALNNGILVGAVVSVSIVATITAGLLAFVFRRKKTPKITLVDRAVSIKLRLVDKIDLTCDTIKVVFALPSPEHVLGLPVGNHIYLKANIDGKIVVRSYTPTSLVSQLGYVDLIIKVYKPNEKFPTGGRMSQYVNQLEIGDEIDISGPAGLFEYKGCGLCHIKPDLRSPPVPRKIRRISMICGGSGITPMYQLLTHILNSVDDETSLALLFANQSDKHVILRDELINLQDKHPDQFRLWFTVNESTERSWKYSIGFVNENMLLEHIHPPGDDTLALICGPAPMVEFACMPNLTRMGYSKENIFVF